MMTRIVLLLLATLPSDPASRPVADTAPCSTPLVGNWPIAQTYTPLPLNQVHLRGFLGNHVQASNDSLIAGLASPLPRAFEARDQGKIPPPECRRLATDSDFYKWLEGACYAIACEPDRTALRDAVDRFVQMIVRLQEPGGYVGTRLLPAQPFDEKVRHDLYVAGHLIEAAVAHYSATGKRDLLDTAVRLADFYRRAYEQDHPYFRLISQEHPEIELALIRLGRATGETRFIEFSRMLTARARLNPPLAEVVAGASRRHAVRLCYQLIGAAELELQTGESSYRNSLLSLWDEIVSTRMYVTGGIGYNEVVPPRPFDLPQTLDTNPNRDIAETCASVSLMMFSWRMHGLTGESRFFDTIETILYNHCLGALSPDHRCNFYYNPLRRVGDLRNKTDHGGNPLQRTCLPAIHSTACCLPNAWRFFAQLPEYVFSTRGEEILINLYTSATASQVMQHNPPVQLKMETNYPHSGIIDLAVTPANPTAFTISLRIPAWCADATVAVNAEPAAPAADGGYVRLSRTWRAGDRVRLNLRMEPALILPLPEVEANRGQVALRRGPLIYCLEQEDAAGLPLDKLAIALPPTASSPPAIDSWSPDLQAHVLKIAAVEVTDSVSTATRPIAGGHQPRTVQLIPFYLRANRGTDPRWMTWIPAIR